MAIPGKRLRFQGSLGPFQELPVTGVMTISLVPSDAGTDAVVTYRLSGDPFATSDETETLRRRRLDRHRIHLIGQPLFGQDVRQEEDRFGQPHSPAER